MTPKVNVSIVYPCWRRPLGTRQMLNDIVNQNANGWELNMVGDCCLDFEALITSPKFHELKLAAEANGNKINATNLPRHGGGSGHLAIQTAIDMATKEYIVFVANDDRISPWHLMNYYDDVASGQFEMCLKETVVKGVVRVPKLQIGQVGHSEIIVKTKVAQEFSSHSARYGHDWDFITKICKSGARIGFSNRQLRTYYVSRVLGDSENE